MYDELHYFYGILPPLRHTLLGNNGDGQGVLPASSTLYHPSSMSQGRTFKPDYAERHYLARSNVHEPLSARGWISGSTCLPVTLALLLNYFCALLEHIIYNTVLNKAIIQDN